MRHDSPETANFINMLAEFGDDHEEHNLSIMG